jgi:hypothetical protein
MLLLIIARMSDSADTYLLARLLNLFKEIVVANGTSDKYLLLLEADAVVADAYRFYVSYF